MYSDSVWYVTTVEKYISPIGDGNLTLVFPLSIFAIKVEKYISPIGDGNNTFQHDC